jgi:hypothetical protein
LATIPYFVVAHRQSFLENLITPVFLGVLILLDQWLKERKEKRKRVQLIGLMLLVFLSGWLKVTGFIIPFLVGGWMLINKKAKTGWRTIMLGLLSILAYLGYGLITNSQGFLQTLTHQGGRGAFVGSFFYGLTQPEFYGSFKDGWYVLGFVISFWLLSRYKEKPVRFWAWFFTGWVLVLFLTAGRFTNSPWFRYPLFPFMAIAIGNYVNRLLKENSLFMMLPVFLLGMTGFDLAGIEISPNLVRLFTGILFLPFGLRLVWDKKPLKQLTVWATRVFLIGLVLVNIWASLRFSTAHCLKERCLPPQKIIVNHE